MRPFSTSFLLVGALAAGAATFNCAGSDDSSVHDDEASLRLARALDVDGIGNPIGLRLLYEPRSSTIHATIFQPLAEGEYLRLQLRRGRLSAQSPLELDCYRLPTAPPMPPQLVASTSGSTSAYRNDVSYQGPIVDPSLLATVYDEQWILDHVSPKMLEELQTQGADAIVEACVMSGASVKARVQTSVAAAWNQDDPLLAYHAPTVTTIDVAMRVANEQP